MRAVLLLLVCLPLGFLAEVVPRYGKFRLRTEAAPVEVPSFLGGDGLHYRSTVASLVEDRDLELRNNIDVVAASKVRSLALGKDGQWYPKHSILLPLLSVPFFAIGGDLGLLVFNVLQCTLLGLALFLAVRRHVSERATFAVTLWFAFGTLIRPLAYNYSPDVLSTLLVMAGYLGVVSGRPLLAGAMLGLSLWAKLPNAVLLPPLGVLALQRFSRRDLLRFGAALLGPVAVVGVLQTHMFGAPWISGYDRVMVDAASAAPVLEESHWHFFDRPFFMGLWEQLSDTKLGLVVSAPAILLAMPGLWFLSRRSRAEAAVIATMSVSQIALFAPYRLWDQTTQGHRFLLTAIVLSAIPVGVALERWLGGREVTPVP